MRVRSVVRLAIPSYARGIVSGGNVRYIGGITSITTSDHLKSPPGVSVAGSIHIYHVSLSREARAAWTSAIWSHAMTPGAWHRICLPNMAIRSQYLADLITSALVSPAANALRVSFSRCSVSIIPRTIFHRGQSPPRALS